MVTTKKYKPETVRAAFNSYFVGQEGEDGEQRAYCPICEDPKKSKTPSASFNAEEGVWNCLKGNHGGKIYALVQDLKKETGFDIRSEAMRYKNANDTTFNSARNEGLQRSGRAAAPLPSEDKIQEWNSRLLSDKKVLADFMSQRGITERTIVEYQIGWDGQRYTFPIYDADDQIANVRRYKMNATQHADKMLNIPGHGTAMIYGMDMLAENKEIVLTEGETDRLLLVQEGIPAVTHTAGAQTFRSAWAPLFEGKRVWVCYDADEAGKKGAQKVKSILAPFADAVYLVTIPLPDKGADITDYLHKEGHSVEDFRGLMLQAESAPGAGPRTVAPVPTTGKKISLLESMAQDMQTETLELTVSVAGKQAEPFTAPKRIEVNCDMSKGAACNNCPVAFKDGAMEMEIRPDDEELFRFVDVPETRRKTLLKEVTGARCTDRSEFEVVENYHIEELLVQPSVDDRREDETQLPVRRTTYSVSTYRSSVNEKVRLVGRNVPDPKSGKLRFVAWQNERVEMDIDKFVMTPEIYGKLSKFRVSDDQTPLQKCLEIASDMAENVTHIYGRDLLHVAYDLVWHSVQSFKVFDFTVEKGWLEMMVVGDTRTGKSEIANRLIRHYNSGQLLSCEGMSFAGIVGGVQQIDGRWHMTWGAVPMNDRRLVVLDEVSGMADKNVIEQMSSIRSSGIAQITKIQSEQTSARTRLIWISNPADGSDLSSKSEGGMAALRSVVQNNEDIARFDLVTAAARGDVDDSVINSNFSEAGNPAYGSEESELLVKWAWSLKRADVIVSEVAAKMVIKAAQDLGSRYVADPPLIQSENVRFKVLRIAAALAARTFSANSKGKLLVRGEHIKDAVKFLDMIYEQESMGYARKSHRSILATARAKERREACIGFLREREDDVLMTLKMVGGNTFRTRDFKDFAGLEESVAQKIVKRLLSWRMVHLKSRGDIAMDPVLISILRELEDEDD